MFHNTTCHVPCVVITMTQRMGESWMGRRYVMGVIEMRVRSEQESEGVMPELIFKLSIMGLIFCGSVMLLTLVWFGD